VELMPFSVAVELAGEAVLGHGTFPARRATLDAAETV
jgi:hypothetical protein